MKYCPVCKKFKKYSDFYRSSSRKDGYRYKCKKCDKEANRKQYLKYTEKIKNKVKQYAKDFPWKHILSGIKRRCNNQNDTRYHRYGGRGIKCLITENELKELWLRDKAWLLKHPSIDREDNDGDYTFDNCRFIEVTENTIKANKENSQKILQFDLQKNLVCVWENISELENQTEFHRTNIYSALCGKGKTAYGFIWKYKAQ